MLGLLPPMMEAVARGPAGVERGTLTLRWRRGAWDTATAPGSGTSALGAEGVPTAVDPPDSVPGPVRAKSTWGAGVRVQAEEASGAPQGGSEV